MYRLLCDNSEKYGDRNLILHFCHSCSFDFSHKRGEPQYRPLQTSVPTFHFSGLLKKGRGKTFLGGHFFPILAYWPFGFHSTMKDWRGRDRKDRRGSETPFGSITRSMTLFLRHVRFPGFLPDFFHGRARAPEFPRPALKWPECTYARRWKRGNKY